MRQLARWIECSVLVGVLVMAFGAIAPAPAAAQPDDRTRVFNAPADRVWTVTRSTLRGLGWDIDKEDREGNWIRTDSRRLEGEDYGVYAKGTRQRLRLVVKPVDANRTAVTVERRVYKQERILWMDKEEDLPSRDHTAEKQVLDAIAAAL
jgi:hypothetical protein